MAVCYRRLDVYRRIDRLRRQRKLFIPDRVSRTAGIFRWRTDPGRLLGSLSAFSNSAPAARDYDRRGPGRPRPDRGTGCGRLDN